MKTKTLTLFVCFVSMITLSSAAFALPSYTFYLSQKEGIGYGNVTYMQNNFVLVRGYNLDITIPTWRVIEMQNDTLNFVCVGGYGTNYKGRIAYSTSYDFQSKMTDTTFQKLMIVPTRDVNCYTKTWLLNRPNIYLKTYKAY